MSYRCCDVIELIGTVIHFRQLEITAEIGGAGNQTLDALVRDIHEKYVTGFHELTTNVQDVFDLDPLAPFMKAFFTFRSLIKVRF